MTTAEYRIEQKYRESWFGLHFDHEWEYIRATLNELRQEHPEREYRLVKITTVAEVVG